MGQVLWFLSSSSPAFWSGESGVGQIIKTQRYKALIGYSLFFLLPIIFFLFKLQFSFSGIITLILSLIILYFINIFDAFFSKADQKINNKILLSRGLIKVDPNVKTKVN